MIHYYFPASLPLSFILRTHLLFLLCGNSFVLVSQRDTTNRTHFCFVVIPTEQTSVLSLSSLVSCGQSVVASPGEPTGSVYRTGWLHHHRSIPSPPPTHRKPEPRNSVASRRSKGTRRSAHSSVFLCTNVMLFSKRIQGELYTRHVLH